jgi:uncharacterized protein with FMN-binding domain
LQHANIYGGQRDFSSVRTRQRTAIVTSQNGIIMQTRLTTLQHSIGAVCCALLLAIIAGCGTGESTTDPVGSADDANVTQAGNGATENNDPAQSPFEVPSETKLAEKSASNDVPDKPVNIEGPTPDKVDSPKPKAKDDPPPQPSSSTKSRNELETALAELEVPPTWLASVSTRWDMNKPWKDGRIEIRRLLGKGDKASQREAIKLTWDYLQKDDIGNGHEYPMYMFLGNEPVWAVRAYREWLAKPENQGALFGLKALAALYVVYGMFDEAENLLDTAMKNLPGPPWTAMRRADTHDAYGDLYAAWGKLDLAKKNYGDAIRIYPTSKPPYGGHLLRRRAAKVQSKLDTLSFGSLEGRNLKDGTFREKALGYSGDIHLTVQVTGGRVSKIDVKHQEKIEQNSSVIIPRRIIEKNSLQVDGVSGATVTKDAIVGGTFRALKKAGLK